MSVQDEREWVAIGVITRPHGLRGELKVHPFNRDSVLWKAADAMHLKMADGEFCTVGIKKANVGPKVVLMTLDGVADRNHAEELRGVEIGLFRDELPAPAEDEYYLRDLIDAKVIDEDGNECGVVTDIASYPTTDCAKIDVGDAFVEVPLNRPFFVDFNAGESLLTIRSLEGLSRTKKKAKK